MLLVCPTCEASYQIDDGKIGPSGRTVRCKKCATVWFATLPLEPEPFVAEEIALAPDAQPVAQDEAAPAGLDDRPSDGLVTETADQPASDATRDAVPEGEAPAGEAATPADAPLEHIAVRSGRAKAGKSAKSGKKRFAMPSFGAIDIRKSAPYAAFGLCLTLVTAVAVREPLARGLPALRPVFAAIGLPVARTPVTIAQVRSELTRLDKAEVLIVEGELTNSGGRAVSVPPVQIVVRDAAGTEIYVWSADVLKPSLQGGETSPFRARLASPPPNGRSVAVRFAPPSVDSADKAAKRS